MGKQAGNSPCLRVDAPATRDFSLSNSERRVRFRVSGLLMRRIDGGSFKLRPIEDPRLEGPRMQAIGFPGTFASAAKIASRCQLENAAGPVVADRQDKLYRWHAARRISLSAEDATGVSRETLFCWDRRRQEGHLLPADRQSAGDLRVDRTQSAQHDNLGRERLQCGASGSNTRTNSATPMRKR